MNKKKWMIVVMVLALTLVVGQIAVFASDRMTDHGQHHNGSMGSMMEGKGMGSMMKGKGMGSMMEGMDMESMMEGMDMSQMPEQCKQFHEVDA